MTDVAMGRVRRPKASWYKRALPVSGRLTWSGMKYLGGKCKAGAVWCWKKYKESRPEDPDEPKTSGPGRFTRIKRVVLRNIPLAIAGLLIFAAMVYLIASSSFSSTAASIETLKMWGWIAGAALLIILLIRAPIWIVRARRNKSKKEEVREAVAAREAAAPASTVRVEKVVRKEEKKSSSGPDLGWLWGLLLFLAALVVIGYVMSLFNSPSSPAPGKVVTTASAVTTTEPPPPPAVRCPRTQKVLAPISLDGTARTRWYSARGCEANVPTDVVSQLVIECRDSEHPTEIGTSCNLPNLQLRFAKKDPLVNLGDSMPPPEYFAPVEFELSFAP